MLKYLYTLGDHVNVANVCYDSDLDDEGVQDVNYLASVLVTADKYCVPGLVALVGWKIDDQLSAFRRAADDHKIWQPKAVAQLISGLS
jgi:hypothetical protein